MPHAYATYFDVNYLVKGVAMIRSLLASDPGSSVRVVLGLMIFASWGIKSPKKPPVRA